MFMQDSTRFATSGFGWTVPLTALSGVIAGTRIDTAHGWRAVESLRPGDRVHSFDGGLRVVRAVQRTALATGTALVILPGGVMDNCTDVALLPDQHLLLDTCGDSALPDAAVVLIPAAALAGYRGCHRSTSAHATEVMTLMFDEDEVIWANSGVLLHCPALANPQADAFFTRLSVPEARAFLLRRDMALYGLCA